MVNVVSTPVSSSGTLLIASMISDRSAVGLGSSSRRSCPKATTIVNSPLSDDRWLSIELVDVGVDRLDVLAQPLPLGLEASRGVERPDDQRPPLLQPADDLDRDPVDCPLDATDHLGAVASNRDGLPEHRRRGHDDLGRPPHVELDQLRCNPMR